MNEIVIRMGFSKPSFDLELISCGYDTFWKRITLNNYYNINSFNAKKAKAPTI